MALRSKLIIFLALLVFASVTVLADTAFDGWLYSGQSITAEGRTFLVYKDASNHEMIADYGGGSMFVANNSCEQNANVRLCLDNIEYYFDARSYRMKVRAISLVPKISVTRIADEDEFEAGQGTRVAISISNTGGLAENVVYTEKFPEGMVVESVDGAAKTPTGIRWEKRTLKSGTETFSYNIRVDDVIDRALVGTLEYFDGIREKTIRTSAINIKTSPRLLQEFKLGFESQLTNEKNNFTINVTNREPLTANVTVILSYDTGLVITRIPRDFRAVGENQLKGNFLVTKTNATYNKSQAYYFEFTGKKTGTFNLNADVSYLTGTVSERKLPTLKKEVKITQKGVKIRTNLEDMEMESGQEKTLRIWLQNLNPAISLKNILIRADGGGLLYLPDSFIGSLSPNEHNKVVETRFFAPNVSVTTGKTIRVNVSYITEFDENFSSEFVATSTVNKIDGMVITKTSSKQLLESGEDATITVKVKNQRKTRLNSISVSESVPREFFIFGSTSAVMALAPGDEQTAYTYVIKAPRTKREVRYLLNTTVAYSDANAGERFANPRGYLDEKSMEVSVKPQKFELTGTRTVDDSGIFLGDYFYLTYIIKNPSDDSTAKNIFMAIPAQEEFDLVGSTRVVPVNDLAPGEEVTLISRVSMRAKKAGTFYISKTPVSYENGYGEQFAFNITETSVNVKDKAVIGTFVFISKNTTPTANNTDEFLVNLSVTNKGSRITSIHVEDGSFISDFAIKNGSSINFAYPQKISVSGKYVLPVATASYKFDGKELLAGSNRPVIEVVDNPVVVVEKIAPASAVAAEEFNVTIIVKPLAGGIKNLTISDEGLSASYAEVTGTIAESYMKAFSESGQKTLPQATAAYTFNGISYTAVSGNPAVNIIAELFLLLNKSFEVRDGKPKSGAVIEVRNIANDEITAVIEDVGESWTVTLAPGEQKTLKHPVSAPEPQAATATFSHRDKKRVAASNIPELPAQDADNGKVIKEGNKVGLLEKLLNAIKAVLTWQR